MRNAPRLLCCLLAAFTLSTTAQAICTRPAPKLCSVFFTHELVVRAKVLKIENTIDPKDPDGVGGWNYHVDVIKTYRGATFKRQTIYSDNTTSRLLLTEGKEYVIFANKSTDGLYEASGNCSGIQTTEGEAYSTKLNAAIATLKQTRHAYIEIEFRNQCDELAPLSGVSISSKAGKLAATPNKQGMFRRTVTPGTYAITLPESIVTSSYDQSDIDRAPVTLAPGQCAQIALVAATINK